MKPTCYARKTKTWGKETIDLFDTKKWGRKDRPLYEIDLTKYKLVPLEPTEEIIQSGCMEIGDIEVFDSLDCVNTYKAMIEAAPDIEDIE